MIVVGGDHARRVRPLRSTCCRRVMRPSIESARIALPRYSMTWPMPPPVPSRPMIASTMSFAVTPGGTIAVDLDRHRLRPPLGQRLGGEHVLDLGGADPEGERAEGAVRRGVAVAADDRHARLGEALLRPDDVDDALVRVAHRVERDAELGAVGVERLELASRDLVLDRLVDVLGRHVVVRRREREIGSADRAAFACRSPSKACGEVTS